MLIKDYVPFFISKIREFEELYNSQQTEIDKLNFDTEDILKQCFISSATWGVANWESFLGIKANTGNSLEDRRNRCIAKIRGTGTTTVQVIQSIVESYVQGTINIIENTKDYSFLIDVQSRTGFPKMGGLRNSIEEVKPAHLQANYKFTSITDMGIYTGNYLYTGENITIYPKKEG